MEARFKDGGGEPFLSSVGWLIGMVNHGPWDYKLIDDAGFRVPTEEEKYEEYYDKAFYEFLGHDPTDENRRNWTEWIYFDGMMWGADQIGNLNMAYVGYSMELPQWVYSNFTTRDDARDIFAVDYGITMARTGR